MRFIVQKIPSRDVRHLHAQIPGLIECEAKPGEHPMQTFLRSLEFADGEAHVHLEDDITLTSDFMKKILAAIQETGGHEVITFFTMKRVSSARERRPGRTFCMFQCTYMPPLMARAVLNFYRAGWRREADHPTGFDLMFADFLSGAQRDYIIWSPNLVQHQEVTSAIDPRRSTKRQSRLFQE